LLGEAAEQTCFPKINQPGLNKRPVCGSLRNAFVTFGNAGAEEAVKMVTKLAGALCLTAAVIIAPPAPAGAASSEAASASTVGGQTVPFTIPFGGTTRTFSVYLPPSYDAARPLPLMIVYHGKGGGGAQIERKTGFDGVAAANSFLVAYPDAQGSDWVLSGANNDVDFTKSMIQSIQANFPVDATRIYASGFSEGANMVGVVACLMTDQIAGFGEVAGALNRGIARRCAPSRPITGIFFHGTADLYVPYNGGANRMGKPVYSAQDTAGFWAGANGCAALNSASVADTLNDGSSVTDTVETWTGCSGGTSVTFWTIQNGGHTWPGGWIPAKGGNAEAGLTSTGLNASMLIWQTLSPTHLAPASSDTAANRQ
jgi:polyhydroxybutyrate depolymerase